MNEPQDPPLEWVTDTANFIKSIAPKQLVTVGFEGKQGKMIFNPDLPDWHSPEFPGEWWYKRVHSPAAVDYGCAHLWVHQRARTRIMCVTD